ncbi:MAG TPA: rod shape-determining protein RodA [Gemmatimonadaceae bacterium]|nr:rod shape-determining protein RodA [Gemmatimonadaceae bacterium]
MIRKAVADYPLAMVALLLTAFGIAVVYSAGQTEVPNAAVQNAWIRQLTWLAVGMTAFLVVTRMSVRFLEWAALPAYLIGCGLLVLTLIIGTGAGTAESMKGWIEIGGRRLGQPSEFAKIAVAMMLARVLASTKVAPKSLVDLIKPGIVVLIPWVLVMAQPDLGTSLVFIGLFFAMLFWSGASGTLLLLAASPVISLLFGGSTWWLWATWFILLLVVVWLYKPFVVEGVVLIFANLTMGVAAPVVWNKLEPHQQDRLLTFLDPSRDPKRSGYQVLQSRIAIGSGGWTGKGYTEGSQKRNGFLPEQETDFIFAVLGEELGFIGVSVALTLFLLLFLRIIRVAMRASDSFSSLVAFGLAGSWFVHVIVNVGMTINLMPITGIPLPFFSYGGSFMLACWIAVGILVRISSEGRGRPGELGLA